MPADGRKLKYFEMPSRFQQTPSSTNSFPITLGIPEELSELQEHIVVYRMELRGTFFTKIASLLLPSKVPSHSIQTVFAR